MLAKCDGDDWDFWVSLDDIKTDVDEYIVILKAFGVTDKDEAAQLVREFIAEAWQPDKRQTVLNLVKQVMANKRPRC